MTEAPRQWQFQATYPNGTRERLLCTCVRPDWARLKLRQLYSAWHIADEPDADFDAHWYEHEVDATDIKTDEDAALALRIIGEQEAERRARLADPSYPHGRY